MKMAPMVVAVVMSTERATLPFAMNVQGSALAAVDRADEDHAGDERGIWREHLAQGQAERRHHACASASARVP